MRKALMVFLGLLVVLNLLFVDWQRQPTPEQLAHRALYGVAAADQELAAWELAGRGPQAVPSMRRVLAESGTPAVVVAMIQGLGSERDFASSPQLLKYLEDPDLATRRASGQALAEILGADYQFRADGPPAERAAATAYIQKMVELMAASPPTAIKE